MAKLMNPAEPVGFVPEDQRDLAEGARITYQLKVPNEWDRINLHKALAAHGARQVGWIGLARAMRELIEQWGDAPTLAMVDTFIALAKEWGALPMGDSDEARAARAAAFGAMRDMWRSLKPVADACAAASTEFASLRGDDAVYLEVYALEAGRILLRGWSGPGLPKFARGMTGVPLELLKALPGDHLIEISFELDRLLRPSEAEAGNSVSPSPGVSVPTSSTTVDSPTAAGPAT